MSLQTLSLAPSNTTDARFRLWGGGIAAAIVAAGLVKTADTGQIDWATVLRPTGINVSHGYEIYRFDDTLQATHPVFLRVDYGSGGAGNNPGINLTVGTATNGAGVISSANPNSYLSYITGSSPVMSMFGPQFGTLYDWSSTSANPFYVDSDDGSSLLLTGWWQAVGSGRAADAGGLFLIERTRDLDGTPNGNGLFIVHRASPTTSVQAVEIPLDLAQSFQPGFGQIPAMTPDRQGLTTGLVGGTLHVFPVFTGFGPGLQGASKHLVSLLAADQALYTDFSVSNFYGGAATFKSLGTASTGWNMVAAAAATVGFRIA